MPNAGTALWGWHRISLPIRASQYCVCPFLGYHLSAGTPNVRLLSCQASRTPPWLTLAWVTMRLCQLMENPSTKTLAPSPLCSQKSRPNIRLVSTSSNAISQQLVNVGKKRGSGERRESWREPPGAFAPHPLLPAIFGTAQPPPATHRSVARQSLGPSLIGYLGFSFCT